MPGRLGDGHGLGWSATQPRSFFRQALRLWEFFGRVWVREFFSTGQDARFHGRQDACRYNSRAATPKRQRAAALQDAAAPADRHRPNCLAKVIFKMPSAARPRRLQKYLNQTPSVCVCYIDRHQPN